MLNFEEIINSANMYLSVKDKNLKYLFCSEKVANSLGLDSPQQIVGKTDYDLFPEEIAHTYRQGDLHILKGGVLLNRPEIHPDTDKTVKILTTKNPLKNKQGKLLGVIVHFVKLTSPSNTLSSGLDYDPKLRLYKFTIAGQTEFFTEREYIIFKKILLGLSAKQIGKQLALSFRTVEDYINRIKYKFNCSSKAHLIETALKLGRDLGLKT